MKPIYLDHCATTPIDPTVLDAMMPFFRESFGNPGTPHQEVGGIVQRAVRDAREKTAELINCRPNELIWTSGATEANNLAILGFAETVAQGKRHIVTQVTEHSAVLEPCRYLESRGWTVTYIPVDSDGLVDFRELADAISDRTSLVSVMWGNNEIGTIQPVNEIAQICAEREIVFHCDAAQAVGKIPIDLEDIPVAMLTLSAHKFYGPKGVGALFVRDMSKQRIISPRSLGGGQESGLRAGTHNVPGIVGMGAACDLVRRNMFRWLEHTQNLRDNFEASLVARLGDLSINGSVNSRLPHISNIAFFGIDNEGLLTVSPEIVASTGSACHVADFAPSHVLVGLNKGSNVVESSLRFGFGKDTTEDEVSIALKILIDSVKCLRQSDPGSSGENFSMFL